MCTPLRHATAWLVPLMMLLALLLPARAQTTFTGHVITLSADGANSVYAADLNDDGDLDVLSASSLDDTIAWYENDGNENFTQHVITTSADGVNSVYAADVDGDGDLDVLSASSPDETIAWYENDGNENFTQHVISNQALGANSVYAADVDGDGDLDVLSAFNHTIAWYENDGNENFTQHVMPNSVIGASSVYAADLNDDGDLDVLSASFLDFKISWFENDGNENFLFEQVISNQADGANSVYAADVDGDGDLDVLSASSVLAPFSNGDKIAWYENDGNENFTQHVITTSARAAEDVYAADVDGDGDLDVLSASSLDDKIAWYENDGNENFTGHVISNQADGAKTVYAADVDGDGDLDVLSASFQDDKIAWFENLTPSLNQPPTITADFDPVTVDEGQPAANTGTVSDPDGDPVALSASAGSIVNNNDGTWTWSFTPTDGPAQSQTVTINADDGHGGTTTATFELLVENVAPTLGAVSVPADPVALNDQPLTASAPFSDPAGSTDEPYTCTVDYGDGTGAQPGSVSGTTCTGPEHGYTQAGIYAVTVTVTDKDGATDTATAEAFIVVYDPSAGFVTGGGWIASPEGAYVADPTLTGKASFGFVAKYKKGKSTPDGNTQFQFTAGGLRFHSTSYDWLVVAGTRAKFKGEGMINEAGSYGFLLTATDGEPDLFRIKIWDKADGDAVVYDNQMGAGEDSEAGTALGGGSIVIHSGKGPAGKTAAGAAAPVEGAAAVPLEFALSGNYPNPFNPSTEIGFALPEASTVRLVVYDVLGREVARLVDGAMAAGQHRVRFEASHLPSGTYLYRIEAGVQVQTRRMVLLK